MIAAGTKLGPYEIVSPLGAGGQRFIICYEPGQPNVAIALVENWDVELKKK